MRSHCIGRYWILESSGLLTHRHQNYYSELAKYAVSEPLRLLVQHQIYYSDQTSFSFTGDVIYMPKKPVSCKHLKVYFQSNEGSYGFVDQPAVTLMGDRKLNPGVYRFPFRLTLDNPSILPSAPKSIRTILVLHSQMSLSSQSNALQWSSTTFVQRLL